jgi:hypothetical protein
MENTLTTTKTGAIALIQNAMATGVSPEHLRELLAVRREWEADEARKAFNLSVSEFQRRAPIVAKADKAYDKEYARMDRIWREIRPLLTELGLSVTWQICELKDGSLCHVEGQLRHRDGHGERLAMDVPVPELIKGQNKAQQMGSATTYAKRYALTGALGIVTGDDDDGHRAGTQFVTYEQAQQIRDLIETAKGVSDFDEAKFWRWIAAESATEISAARFPDAVAALKRKISGK